MFCACVQLMKEVLVDDSNKKENVALTEIAV